MQTVTLGKNGLTVTALGIGTWAWGDKLFWNYGNAYGADRVREAYQAAVDAGISFFDTAEVYGLGESETLLGQFMQADSRTVAIATKYGPAPWRLWGDSVAEAVTASLKRLQRDRIELYQVHWPFTFFMSQFSWEVLRRDVACLWSPSVRAEGEFLWRSHSFCGDML